MVLCPDCRRDLPDGLGAERCGRCGWERERRDGVPVYLSGRDRENQFFASYLANYDRIAEVDLGESIQPEAFLAVQAERLEHHIGDVRGLRVCDLGIGKGILLERLLRAGAAHVTGVDIAMRYLERFSGRTDMSVLFANAENLPFREEFDLIVAADVVEHVVNVGDLLVGAREALAPEGRLVVRVPYREDMTQHAHLNGCMYELVHLRNFAKDNLTDLLRRSGFAIDAVRFDGFFAWRARGPLAGTRGGRLIWRGIVAGVLGGEDGLYRINPVLGRLLMTPMVITAVARKR